MPRSFLHDKITGKRYDLTALAKENNDEISIGRVGNGNDIELGLENVLQEDKNSASRISRHHATIKYLKSFYIKDHSKNGTRVNNRDIEEEFLLSQGDKIWVSTYGPLVYEEQGED
jgi:pSer/pThr/pTyr-binding forkhead associated (FHA) protein